MWNVVSFIIWTTRVEFDAFSSPCVSRWLNKKLTCAFLKIRFRLFSSVAIDDDDDDVDVDVDDSTG